MNENTRLLERYRWNNAELAILQTTPVETICDKITSLDDQTFNNLIEAFDAWILENAPKRNLNKWLKKANLTIEELNIWCTL